MEDLIISSAAFVYPVGHIAPVLPVILFFFALMQGPRKSHDKQLTQSSDRDGHLPQVVIARNRINSNVDNVASISLHRLHWDVRDIKLPMVLLIVGIHIDPMRVLNGAF